MVNMGKGESKGAVLLLWAAVVLLAMPTVCLYGAEGAPDAAVQTAPLDTGTLAANFAALDLNAATAQELEELPGVGPVLAERIILRREEQGPFAAPEDVLQVPGIGPATFAQMEPYITVGGGMRNEDPGG